MSDPRGALDHPRTAWNSTLPERSAPMPRSAFRPPVASRPVITAVDMGPGTAPPRTRRETGFSAVTKLAIRTRAGNGDPDDARCEATGVWLGRYGGEIQHRNARRAGGSRLRNNIANGALLSGEAHRLAEARDPHMHEAGFWLLSTEDALQVPILLAGQDGGMQVWLDDSAHYVDQDGNILTAPRPYLGGAA